MLYVLTFVLAAGVVATAGTALARYGDELAEVTGIGRVWIGAVVVAGATSLPELATDIAAVRMGAVDLAVGDLFGSSMANMLILAIVDLLPPRQHVLRRVTLDHALAACLAMGLNVIATMLVLLRPTLELGWVGPGSVLLFVAYVVGTRAVYRQVDTASAPATVTPAAGPSRSPRHAILGFAAATVAILVAAPLFAWAAKGIASLTGLGTTFVGTWLVGMATSLPELVACIAAVRMGSFDLAVGNLFGSNAFNMAVFLPLDLAHPGNVFAAIDPSHALSGLAAVFLMSLGLAAIVYRAKRRFAMLEPDSLAILAVYVATLALLYHQT